MKPVTYNGVVYRSMVALHRACAAPSVTYQHLTNRLRAGWELGDALTTAGDTNAVTYKGRVFPSLRAIHSALAPSSISLSSFLDRVSNLGWSIEKALAVDTAKPTEREFVVDGIVYKGIAELARAAGISYSAAVRRCYRGFSDQEMFYGRQKKGHKALEQPKGDRRRRPVVIAGVQYASIKEAYKALKPKATLCSVGARLRKGWAIEQAFELEKRVDGRSVAAKHKLTIDGAALSVREAALKYGIKARSIRDRLNRGATSAQAVGIEKIPPGSLQRRTHAPKNAPRPRKQVCYEVDGTAYASVASLARAYEMPYALVSMRITRYGWDPKRAVSEPPYESVVVNGVCYPSATHAWRAVGRTPEATFNRRRMNGHSLGQCLGLEPMPTRTNWEIGGKTYHSLQEVATSYGLTKAVLQRRLVSMDIEEAVRFRGHNVGRYTLRRCKQNRRLAKSLATLYFVRVTTHEGVLQKIGITRQSVAGRFSSHRFELLSTYWGSLESVLKMEQGLLRRFSMYLYAAEKSFGGRTETLLLLPEEECLVQEQIRLLGERHRCTPGAHVRKRRSATRPDRTPPAEA